MNNLFCKEQSIPNNQSEASEPEKTYEQLLQEFKAKQEQLREERDARLEQQRKESINNLTQTCLETLRRIIAEGENIPPDIRDLVDMPWAIAQSYAWKIDIINGNTKNAPEDIQRRKCIASYLLSQVSDNA